MRRISVVVDDAHVDSISAVADGLRARGMQVEQVLDQLGMISGTVADDYSMLWEVEGVGSVEPSTDVQLPPPDAPVQ